MVGLDILIIMVIYLVGLLVLGIWSAKASGSSGDYFLGGRQLGPWVISMSEKASESSGFMTIGLPGEAYSNGISAAWNSVSSVFSIFNWFAIAKPMRRLSEILKSLTVPDFMVSRFKDDSNVIRIIGIIVMTIFQTVYVCAQFVAFGVLFEVVLNIPFAVGVIVGGIVTIIYTVMGGFFAVALTDFIQGLLMAFAFVILPIAGIIEVGGFTALGETLTNTVGSSFNQPFFGETALSLGVVLLITSYLFIGFGFNGSPHIIIRYVALRSTRDVKQIAIIGIVWMMIAYYGAVLIGLVGRAIFPSIAEPEHIFPMLALELFPWWLAGIIIAGALSAMMSSIDSMLLIAASSIAEDLWNKILNKGELSDRKTVMVSRIATIVIGLIGIIIALNPIDSVFWLAVFAWSGLSSCFGPPIILSLYWKKVTKWGAIAGMIVGPVVTVLWKLWPPIDVYEGGPAFILSLIAVALVSLVTRPPEGDDFENMWKIYTEKSEIGAPMPLQSEMTKIKNMKEINLNTDTEIDIVSKLLLNGQYRVASPYVEVKE